LQLQHFGGIELSRVDPKLLRPPAPPMKLHTVLSLVLLSLAGTLPVSAQIDAETPSGSRSHPAKRSFPQITLTESRSQGEKAISQLGSRLPEVAAWYGKSSDEFSSLMKRDRALVLDRAAACSSRTICWCHWRSRHAGPAVGERRHAAAAGPDLPAAQPPGRVSARSTSTSRAPRCRARPGTAAPSITALPFDLDGVPYTFSTAELQRIQAIWQRVAEDFAPFDVNVTTEAPPPTS
jgi:hypothetical protein